MMMKPSIVWLMASILSAQHVHHTTAFSPVPIAPKLHKHDALLRPGHVTTAHTLVRKTLTPLRYRALDEDDDDTTMLKAQSRMPVGYDMRKALKKPPTKSAMNVALIKALLVNQSLILALATAATYGILLFTDGFSGLAQLGDMMHWSGGPLPDVDGPSSWAAGILAAIPMLAFSTAVENSDNRAFANVNFSTITMVMTLFGRRKAPPKELIPDQMKGKPILTTKVSDVLLQSLILSITTGICEETVFRQEVPALLSHYVTGDNIAFTLVAQAVLFALGHASPGGSLAENSIMVGLQTVNGIGFGLIYILTGGNIVACIAAHSVFDFVVFFKTWMDSNAQLEYAESMYSQPLAPEMQRELSQSGVRLDPKTMTIMKRLFYTFDFDKNKTLSLSEVRKGVSYLSLEKAGVPPPQAQVDAVFKKVVELKTGKQANAQSRLTFPEFVLLYSMASQQGKKIPAKAYRY